jgi:hypothetical protein
VFREKRWNTMKTRTCPLTTGIAFVLLACPALVSAATFNGTGGDGNDVTLMVVPEPSVALSLWPMLGVYLSRRRRKVSPLC